MAWIRSVRIAAYDAALPAHAHAGAVICLPLAGAYRERTRGRDTEHRPGDILFCPPNEPHSQAFPRGRTVKLLVEPGDAAEAFLAEHLQLGEAPFACSAAFAVLAARIARELRDRDTGSALAIEGLFLEALAQFARRRAEDEAVPSWLKRAREHVRQSAFETIGPDALAQVVGRPAPLVAAAYRRAFGRSPAEDARAARLERAARLLVATRRPVADIAAACGFFDQPHMTRAFSRAYGMTPGAYRRLIN
jgi:AraC family transcriptional regulator